MVIGVLKEIKDNEYPVAAIPAVVSEIRHHGHSVLVQSGAGVGSGFSDEEYAAAGAEAAVDDDLARLKKEMGLE